MSKVVFFAIKHKHSKFGCMANDIRFICQSFDGLLTTKVEQTSSLIDWSVGWLVGALLGCFVAFWLVHLFFLSLSVPVPLKVYLRDGSSFCPNEIEAADQSSHFA